VITLEVSLGERSYPILIGEGLLDSLPALLPPLPRPRVVVVTNATLAPICLGRVLRAFAGGGVQADTVVIPDGERFKNLATLETLLAALLERRVERSTTLVALGGGVVGDIAGFAAAVYQRGIPFVQVPTTLLAQVDSSVGGKTAVNHPLGKNMIGAFYQPRAVVIDTATLATLPDRELAAGLAEVVKYGLIHDVGFLEWLEGHVEDLLAREPSALAYAIRTSCAVKAAIVGRDERETAERALLNLGHTFGHAIESWAGYGAWLHGEAVAAGTVLAARLSQRLGDLDAGAVGRVREILRRARLPVAPPAIPPDEFLALMARDKKVEAGETRYVLLRRLGEAYVRPVADGVVRDVLG
jgi:3-dehydroquinate synthase